MRETHLQEVGMAEHEPMDTNKYFMVEQQTVRVEDVFSDKDLILDLGGGG